MTRPFRITALAALCTLSLAACREEPATAASPVPTAAEGAAGAATAAASVLSDRDRVSAVAAALQACSYDGSPLRVDPGKLGGKAPADCGPMVDRIMGYTGLPANFVVGAGPVPNAAAVILLDAQQVPRRVIAFNPDFMNLVGRATNNDSWAPISIMAHEIGHHLSGHTIVAGGSRPEIELEADKFSGFVLQKMGASLQEATTAMQAIAAPEEETTHPAKPRRLAAITQGWQEACRQTAADHCSSGAASTPVAANTTATPATATPATTTAANNSPVSLPAPASANIPFKYGRFVVDETGMLDPAKVQQLEQRLFDLSRKAGAEITLLLVKDLHGMSAQDYAWAMMRQLRVGKLDVGNGAVLVVAPEQNQAAVAFGPGVAREMENANPQQSLQRWIGSAWPLCTKKQTCGNWTDVLAMVPDNIRRNTENLEWTIRYQSMGDFLSAYKTRFEADMKLPADRPYDPKANVAYDKIIRFRGKVVSLQTPVGVESVKPEILAIGPIVKRGYQAVQLQSEDGHPVIFYVAPETPALMPGGKLEVGKQYTFVGRVERPNVLEGHAQHLWALSYDPLG